MRKKKKPVLKKRSYYTTRLDQLAKGFAKERDGNICQKTGDFVSGCNAHGSHVVPVSEGMSLRWNIRNILCMGAYQHIYWWHKNPLAASEWYQETFPKDFIFLSGERKKERWRPSTAELAAFLFEAKQASNWREYHETYKAIRYGSEREEDNE